MKNSEHVNQIPRTETEEKPSRGFYDEFNHDSASLQNCRELQPFELEGTSSLSNDGTAGYGGHDACGGLLGDHINEAPKNEQFKWQYLWSGFSQTVWSQLKMDSVARFSVTDMKTADRMSALILSIDGITPNSVITDATACVGGNTVSFAKHFKEINAIEMDDDRFSMLEHNLQVIHSHNASHFLGGVSLYHGDCLKLCPDLRQDVIFVDPPWGGPGYKLKESVQLYLSGLSLPEVCKSLGKHARHVAVKLPSSVDMELLAEQSNGILVHGSVLGKMSLAVLFYQNTLSSDQLNMLGSFGLFK